MSSDILEIKKVTEVDALFQTKVKAIPQSLKNIVDNFTPAQKRYAEYRSKGLKQSDSAKKAGSTAKDRAALGRVGYNWEQIQGMKEYIAFLYEKRAQAAVLDEIEILEKLRSNYELAIELGRVDWANKTLELMGNMIGAYKDTSKAVAKSSNTKNNTEAFKNEGEEVTKDQRFKDIQSIMNSISRTNINKEVEQGQ